jgi:Xaa-Pro dipeptidase
VLDGLRKAATGLRFVSGKPISDGCRMVKDAKELEYMLLANQITKQAYRAALGILREGMSQEELAGTIGRAYSMLGARGTVAVSFGPNSAFPHGSMVRRSLREGDVVLVDDGCTVEGYQSDVTRTVVFGKPSRKQIEVFNVVHEAQAAARRTARAGVPCEDVDAAARGVIEKAGYGPDYKYFTHRLGHGIGMDIHEEPYLVRGNKLTLQPGMTFSDEPGIYIYGEFGIRLEDIMRITGDGCEFLGETQDAIDRP